MKTWSLFADKDGYGIHIVETPLSAHLADEVSNFILTTVLRHRLCCSMPNWTYRFPLGRPIYDRSPEMEINGKPWLDNSLGSWLWNKTTNLASLSMRHEKDVMRLRITKEEARAISPDFIFDDEDEES